MKESIPDHFQQVSSNQSKDGYVDRLFDISFDTTAGLLPLEPLPVAPKDRILPAHKQLRAEETYLEDGRYMPSTSLFFRKNNKNNAALAHHIAPQVLASRPTDAPFRVWDVGCGGGRDTWSRAAAFAIYGVNAYTHGTDINSRSLAVAQQPYVNVNIERFAADIEIWGLPPETAAYFEQTSAGLQPAQELRDRVCFEELDVRFQAPDIEPCDAVVANYVFSHYGDAREPVAHDMLHTITSCLRTGGLFTFSDLHARRSPLTNAALAAHGLVPAPNIYGAENWGKMAFYEKIAE